MRRVGDGIECDTCAHYNSEGVINDDQPEEDWTTRGQCRRYPPLRLATTDHDDDFGYWPYVIGSEWCGEWKLDELDGKA